MTGLFDDLSRHGDKIALIGEDGEPLSYQRLAGKADAIAAPLAQRNLIVIMCKNTAACVAGYAGFMRAGHAIILLHHAIRQEHLADIVERFQPGYIYAPDNGGGYELTKTGSTAPALNPDLALLLPTSGTTGSRQFVRLSRRNLIANARSIIDCLGIKESDRAITTMPMNYAYGLSILHTHMLAGASVILTEHSLVSPAFWDLIRAQRATTFGGVPFIYEMLKKLRFAGMDLPDLRYITQAGGRLSANLAEEFKALAREKKFEFIMMYGQTEATARIAYVPWGENKIGAIGRAIPGVSLSLEDERGQDIIRPGQAGELVCRGDNVSLGYAANAADLARGDDHHGVLYTGDIASQDADGSYTIVGRKKRFLKIFGTRVNLDEVEALLKNAGHDCACSGEDDRMKIYVAGDISGARADMMRLVNLNPLGFEIVLLQNIPRSESGKVDYAGLRQAGRA